MSVDQPVKSRDDTPVLWCPPDPYGCGKEVLVYDKKISCWICPRCGSWWRREYKKLRPIDPEERKSLGMEQLSGPVERVVDHHSGKTIISHGYIKSHSKKKSSSKSGKRHKKKKNFRGTSRPYDGYDEITRK